MRHNRNFLRFKKTAVVIWICAGKRNQSDITTFLLIMLIYVDYNLELIDWYRYLRGKYFFFRMSKKSTFYDF